MKRFNLALLLLAALGLPTVKAFATTASSFVYGSTFSKLAIKMQTSENEQDPGRNAATPLETRNIQNIVLDENGNGFQRFAHRFLVAGGGEIGDRGEVYFFAQALPIVGVALGGVPFLSHTLRIVAGPGLFLFGVAVMAFTALDMGDSLTPWPRPNGGGLVTTGLYSQVRHPMYSGLLSCLTGFSVWTESVDRLLLVALLWLILQVKSDYEEQTLIEAYPDYVDYQKKVPTKFMPRSIVNLSKLENIE